MFTVHNKTFMNPRKTFTWTTTFSTKTKKQEVGWVRVFSARGGLTEHIDG